MPSLQIDSGKHKGKRLKLPAEGTVIGRGDEADLRIASGEISRLHCRIEPKGDHVLVTDLGSSNGTLVDGSPIVEPTLAGAGARLTIGPVIFVVAGPGRSPASGGTKARRKTAVPRLAKSKSADPKTEAATDDDIDSWLTEDVPDKAEPGEDTHILRRDDRPEKPKPPTRTFDSVAEEAADIIRRHFESQEV